MDSIYNSVLLIEDNPMDVDLTLRAFARSKFANPFQIAKDGVEALDYLKRWEEGERPPILILLDLKLPKVDGLEVLRVIRSHPKFKYIPIIVLTTSQTDQDIQTAYMLGANSYIVKPIDFDKFIEVVAQIENYWFVLNKLP
jgi:CheY-like chemotaxis protein